VELQDAIKEGRGDLTSYHRRRKAKKLPPMERERRGG